jgi:hypothetical protein
MSDVQQVSDRFEFDQGGTDQGYRTAGIGDYQYRTLRQSSSNSPDGDAVTADVRLRVLDALYSAEVENTAGE